MIFAILLLTLFSCSHALLTVHLVPHSHDDAGWVRTIDEYYYDSVHAIYDNVLACLLDDPKRRFIVVEQIYFKRWFEESSRDKRKQFFNLLARGQVEFVMGGWVMSDEATVTATAALDQLTVGHQYLSREFGVVPKYAYQIDPFGHAASSAYLFEKVGFNAVVLNRIHYEERVRRENDGEMEFMWKGVEEQDGILAHILDRHYSSPPGFDFDFNSGIRNEQELAEKSEWLVRHWQERSHSYPSKTQFLQLIGDDFRFVRALKQFSNWEMIIEYINQRSHQFGIRIQFSTLDEYFTAVETEKISYSFYTGDFFPYADNQDSYWTGYFTSKPHFKHLVRQQANLKRVAELSTVLRVLQDGHESFNRLNRRLVRIREFVAEVQHHDAVTGTSKEYVTQSYIGDLNSAQKYSYDIFSENLGTLLGTDKAFTADFTVLSDLAKPGDAVDLAIFNSNWHYHHIVEVPAYTQTLAVYDDNGKKLQSQIVPAIPNSELKSSFPLTLLIAVNVKMGETKRVQVRFETNKDAESSRKKVPKKFDRFDISMNRSRIEVGPSNDGFSLGFGDDNDFLDLDPRFMRYESYTGPGQPSGAYIFRPRGDAKAVLTNETYFSMEVIEGKLVKELRVSFGVYHQIYRLYNWHGYFGKTLQIQSVLGPLPLDSEVVLRMNAPTAQDSSCVFKTDAGGLFSVDRSERNSQAHAGNIYPVTAFATMTCKDKSLDVLVDRSVGGGSQSEGHMEVMLHRRTSRDDWRGVEEDLNDGSVVFPVLNIFYGQQNQDIMKYSQVKQYPPVVMYGSPRKNANHKLKQNSVLPPYVDNIQILEANSSHVQILLRVIDMRSKESLLAWLSQIKGSYQIFSVQPCGLTGKSQGQMNKPSLQLQTEEVLQQENERLQAFVVIFTKP